MLSACVKETEVSESAVQKSITYTLTASLSDGTKALISDSGQFSWESGDQVAVLDENSGDLCVFTCSGADGVFMFIGREGRNYNFTKAWYPASMVQSADHITFPNRWDYDDVSSAHHFPMAATISDGKMPFYHLGGLLKLTVNDVPANATTLSLTSDEVSLSGTFPIQYLGLDEGRVDATGESVVVESGAIPVKSVQEIGASQGGGSVNVDLNLSEKQTVTVFLPLPCGTYNYKITLSSGDATILEKTTSSAKHIDRAVILKMAALNITWPQTGLQARYGNTTVAFGPSEFWGWFKASGLPVEQNISIFDPDGNVTYGVRHSTKKKSGYYVECLSGDDARPFPLFAASDLYLSADMSRFFPVASGSAAALPSEYEAACFSLRGNFGSGSYATIGRFKKASDKAEAEGWGWYVVRNVVCTADPVEFKLYSNAPHAADGLVVTGTTTPQNVGIGRSLIWSENGQSPIFYHVTPGMSYDFYLREDLKQVIVYESGSQGAMDEERITGLTHYGLYNYSNASWIYTPGIDQISTEASETLTFVLIDGVSFDQVQMAGLPLTPSVGDVVNVGVTVTPTLGSSKNSTVPARIVKIEGSKVWLLSDNGTGMIVSMQ